ncbi:MAG: hypothetical protein WD708_12465 [Kiritimatiellia bacterium]
MIRGSFWIQAALIALAWGGGALRAEPEEDQWTRSHTAGGRIRVVAKDAVLMQTVSVWATRGLAELEREWGLPIPFQADQPLTVLGSDQAQQVTLQQELSRGVLRQRILIPERMEALDSRELARVFTRALALRILLAALPEEAKGSNVRVPAWLETGSAVRLMGERQGDLLGEVVGSTHVRGPAYPEQTVRRPRGELSPSVEAEAALFCRWLFGRPGVTPAKQKELWASFATRDPLEVTTLRHLSGGSRDLRELHQHWDLWWQQERVKLMAEFRLSGPVLEALRTELRFVPGFYGLYRDDRDRTRSIRFDELEEYLDDPAFASAMAQWSLRLQSLRFRQESDLNDLIAHYQQAISTLAAASREKKKKNREVLLGEALDQWRQAQLLKDKGCKIR